jgi:hypothetical protein
MSDKHDRPEANATRNNVNAMKRILIAVFCLVPANFSSADETIDYTEQVAPLLRKYCEACHNAEDREGGFSVESFADLQKGGENGPAFVPELAKNSRLVRQLTGEAEPKMPPEDNEAPSADEIAMLSAWIDAGARGPRGEQPIRRLLVTPDLQPAQVRAPSITAAARAPDGRTAIALFQRVELRDEAAEQVMSTLTGFPGKVNAVHFSADGSRLVTASGVTGLYGEAIIWNAETGDRVQTFLGHRDILYDAELSPDGNQLATCGYDRKIVLWDVASGNEMQTLEGHNDAIYDLAFSPDGRVLATASGDETVKIWNTQSGHRLDTLSQPQAEQYVVTFSPDGRFIVAGGADNRIRVWRLVSKTSRRINPLIYARFAHDGAVTNLAFTPDGSQLVSVAEDRSVKLWESRQFTQTHIFEPQPDQVTAVVPGISSGGLLVTRIDGSISRYSMPTNNSTSQETHTVATVDDPMPTTESTNKLVEHEPNNRVDTAMTVLLPANISGVIHQSSDLPDEDFYRFTAKAGEQWMIEVNAARQESPLDSTMEVLNANGDPIERVLLRAVRDSYFTFRGKDSTTVDDFRVQNWAEMELNEYLYANGEVVKLWHYPRGPDSGYQVYPGSGTRHTFFDTTALSHALHAPCYIVEPHAPGTSFIPNGLPVYTIFYENDDDALREWGMDSRLTFRAPADGDYVVRLVDARGFQGAEYKYDLTIRPRRPDFKVTLGGKDPEVSPGCGREFSVSVQRIDGFDGEVRVEITDLPPGFHATSPVVIEAGQRSALGTVYTELGVQPPSDGNAKTSKVTARATIHGKEVVRDLGSLGEIKLGETKLIVRITATDSDVAVNDVSSDKPLELTLAPGETVEAKVLIDRKELTERVGFGNADAGRNLPHGVYVDNIGLNGLLIVEGQSERTFFITAAKWLNNTTRWLHLRADAGGNPTSWPVILHIRRPETLASAENGE